MDRRNALASMFAAPLGTLVELANKNSDHIDLEEGTAIAAVRHNGKTYALGFKLGDPRANATQSKWLGSALSLTIAEIYHEA